MKPRARLPKHDPKEVLKIIRKVRRPSLSFLSIATQHGWMFTMHVS